VRPRLRGDRDPAATPHGVPGAEDRVILPLRLPAGDRGEPGYFRVRQCSLVSGGAQTMGQSCELTPEEQKRVSR
jgi:hypothetical protein